jgi:hypothetical protein
VAEILQDTVCYSCKTRVAAGVTVPENFRHS